MPRFEHRRHQPPSPLVRPRELVVACPAMRSNVNLSRIVRVCGCCGVRQIVTSGPAKIDEKIARDAIEQVEIVVRRSLAPALEKLKGEGFQVVGLEQTTNSECLYKFAFQRRTVLAVGNERQGLDDDLLNVLDRAVEIPVYGLPFSYNAATAAAMALYEYCRQFPEG